MSFPQFVMFDEVAFNTVLQHLGFSFRVITGNNIVLEFCVAIFRDILGLWEIVGEN